MNKTLLVTDDAIIIREMIKDLAVAADWTIVGEAQNGAEALQKYTEHRPDVMTLDMVMPEFDGIYALEQIRKLDPQAKIIVVSALNQKKNLQQALSLGAADFLVKPFNAAVLTDTLEKVHAMSIV
jgi:two-component system chemotaxis response regulator CheY